MLGRGRPARGSGPASRLSRRPPIARPRPTAPRGRYGSGSNGGFGCARFSTSTRWAATPMRSTTDAAANGAIRFGSGLTAIAQPSLPSTNAGCAISTICCARLMNCAATICCAFARPKPVMAICCCGSPTLRARSASRGGAQMPPVIGRRPAADGGRGQAEHPSARRPATSFPPHRAPSTEIQRTKCALLPASTENEGAPLTRGNGLLNYVGNRARRFRPERNR